MSFSKKAHLILLLIFSVSITRAQLIENFSDGNFSIDPTWLGDTSQFKIVSEELQSDGPEATETIHIASALPITGLMEWRFKIRLEFDPSSSNYVRAFLFSNQSDLEGDLNGYYLQIGESSATLSDSIDFFRKDGSVSTKLFTSPMPCISNSTNNIMSFRVLRDAFGNWEIWADCNGGAAYAFQGVLNDATYNTTAWFGFLARHTSTRNEAFFFDDIYAGPIIVDTEAPEILSVEPISNTMLKVYFSEPVEFGAESVSNYFLDNGIGNPISAIGDASDLSIVDLVFDSEFISGIMNILYVSGIEDLSTNLIVAQELSFFYYELQAFDLIVSEFLFDEAPSVGLPDAEFIEIFNRAPVTINLLDWTLKDGSSTGIVTLPDLDIAAGARLILCPTTAQGEYLSYGSAVGLSGWPSLNNTGDAIRLVSSNGEVIHSINYSTDWYGDVLKEEGGWSVEMISTENPTLGSCNWTASVGSGGGSPGMINSVNGEFNDQTAPKSISVFPIDKHTLTVVFNESMDSLSLFNTSNYEIVDESINILNALPIGPDFVRVLLTLSDSISSGLHYLSVKNAMDCAGNSMSGLDQVAYGFPEIPKEGEIAINEILYDPNSGGEDFIELYNKTDKLFDLVDLYLIEGEPEDSNTIKDEIKLSEFGRLLLPNTFMAFTGNDEIVRAEYPGPLSRNIISLDGFPSWNDSDKEGLVILEFRKDEDIISVDKVQFSSDWHFGLIDDQEGLSLERIDPFGDSEQAANWTSAAATVGYATPAENNSMYTEGQIPAIGKIELKPPVFSPDQDGFDDFLQIFYSMSGAGYVASALIFDTKGRQIRQLVNNETLGLKGSFRWDGLNENGTKADIGIYVVYVEVFNLNGEKMHFKEPVVLAGRLK